MVRKRMLICGIAIVFVLTLPLVSSAAEKTFVGSETCGACHSDQYADWKTTLHSKMVQDAKTPGAIIGDFSKNKWFKAEDVAYTLGSDNVKYYLRKDFSFLPASWNNETRQWTYAERPTPWSASCASCHTVGYNKEKKSWAELGIGCESCHGPGSAHVEGGGDKTQISKSVDNKVCATCHGGQAEQIETMGHSDIFMKALGTVDKPNKENWDRYAKSGCIRCHSATYILAPADKKPNVEEFKTGTLKDDRISITCAVCHDPHKDTGHEAQLRKDKQETCTQCHQSSGKITLGSSPHHTQKEIFEGALADGKPVEGVPSVPSKKVALCVDCHMPSGTHFFKAGTPTFTYKSHGKDVVADSCGKCHAQMTTSEIKKIQHKTEERIKALEPRLAAAKKKLDELKAKGVDITALKALVDAANTSFYIAEAEGSKGVHNPPYTKVLLDNVEAKIAEFEARTK